MVPAGQPRSKLPLIRNIEVPIEEIYLEVTAISCRHQIGNILWHTITRDLRWHAGFASLREQVDTIYSSLNGSSRRIAVGIQ